MKILMVAPYIYNKSFDPKMRNVSGLGIIINNLCEGLSRNNTIDLFVPRASKSLRVGNIKLIQHSLLNVAMQFRPYLNNEFLYVLKNSNITFKRKMKAFFYILETVIFRRVLNKKTHDVTVIHGAFYRSYLLAKECTRLGQCFVLVLHGTIYKDEVSGDILDKKSEEQLAELVKNTDNKIIVISSGIKKDLINKYNLNPDSIIVIPNGIQKPIINSNVEEIKNKYKIGCSKVVLYIGNISVNKNQKLLIDSARNILSKMDVCFIFAGKNDAKLNLHNYVEELGLDSNVVFTGFLETKAIHELLSIADLTVLLSYSEGFGLSIVEGYSFGVPSLFPADFDAKQELYDENCAFLVSERSVSEVSSAVLFALNNRWDKEKIKIYSNNFTIIEMVKKYENFLNSIICKG